MKKYMILPILAMVFLTSSCGETAKETSSVTSEIPVTTSVTETIPEESLSTTEVHTTEMDNCGDRPFLIYYLKTDDGLYVGYCRINLQNYSGEIPETVSDARSGTVSPVIGIYENVFKDCYNLESITLPASIIEIQTCAFAGCTSLTTFIFKGTMEEFNSIVKGTDWNKDTPFTEVICSDGNVSIK